MTLSLSPPAPRIFPPASFVAGRAIERPDFGKWYLLLAQAQEERSAAAHLIGRRFRTYLPTLPGVTTRGVRRAKVTTQRPMFPGYLFIRLDLSDDTTDDSRRLHFVTATPGIRKFFQHDDHYAVVSDIEMARVELVEREEHRAYTRRTTPVTWIKGEKVRVAEGIFTGQNGYVLRLDGVQGIAIELTLLRRSVKVTLPATALEKL